MQQLPLDLSAYIAEYAVQLFSSLSAAPNALKQVTCVVHYTALSPVHVLLTHRLATHGAYSLASYPE